jgi:hypothetical protein
MISLDLLTQTFTEARDIQIARNANAIDKEVDPRKLPNIDQAGLLAVYDLGWADGHVRGIDDQKRSMEW